MQGVLCSVQSTIDSFDSFLIRRCPSSRHQQRRKHRPALRQAIYVMMQSYAVPQAWGCHVLLRIAAVQGKRRPCLGALPVPPKALLLLSLVA